MIDYPNKLNKIFDKLQDNGASAIIIGGYIRDKLLKIDSKDIDIEVYGVTSFNKLASILEEFGSVNRVGKSFGVCKLTLDALDLDFTLPRKDSKIATGHSGFKVQTQADLDFISATRRRDFTINAIGYDVFNKKILDPFNGINDLKNRVLKAVDTQSFVEDPLRVYRAIQFCARFNLQMSRELFTLCSDMVAKNMLKELSKERVFQEIKKLLLKSQKPSIGFILFKKLDVIKEFEELNSLSQSQWDSALNSLDNLVQYKSDNETAKITIMLSALCYRFDTIKIEKFITKLSDEKELLKRVLALTSNQITKTLTDANLYRVATKVNIEELLVLNKAIYKDTNNSLYKICNELYIRAKELGILNRSLEPLLMGRDILACGISPSKEFSTILKKAYEAQMDGNFSSYKDALSWLKKELA